MKGSSLIHAPGKIDNKMKLPALQIASWNVRTMQTGLSEDLENIDDAPKTSIIDKELHRLNIDIAALQETRLAGFNSLKEKHYTFYWQGMDESERRLHGVGFAVSNSLLHMIESPKEVTERLFSIRLHTTTGCITFFLLLCSNS